MLSTCGDTYLGGDDFDDRLIDLLADEFVAREGINLRNDPYALEKLKVAAETAKKALSVDDAVEIRIPDIVHGAGRQAALVQRTLTAREFGALIDRPDPAHLQGVRRGAAAGEPDRARSRRRDPGRRPDAPADDPRRGARVLPAGAEDRRRPRRGGRDGRGDPRRVAGRRRPSEASYLLDVTPLSLRIGVAGGLAEPVIERNTPVPIEQTRTFTTVQDNQERVKIRVYQGESREAERERAARPVRVLAASRRRARGEVADRRHLRDQRRRHRERDRARPRDRQRASTRIMLSSGLSEEEIEKIIDRGAPTACRPTASEPPAKPRGGHRAAKSAGAAAGVREPAAAALRRRRPAPAAEPTTHEAALRRCRRRLRRRAEPDVDATCSRSPVARSDPPPTPGARPRTSTETPTTSLVFERSPERAPIRHRPTASELDLLDGRSRGARTRATCDVASEPGDETDSLFDTLGRPTSRRPTGAEES